MPFEEPNKLRLMYRRSSFLYILVFAFVGVLWQSTTTAAATLPDRYGNMIDQTGVGWESKYVELSLYSTTPFQEVFTQSVTTSNIKSTALAFCGFDSDESYNFQFKAVESQSVNTGNQIEIKINIFSPSKFSYLSFSLLIIERYTEMSDTLQIVKGCMNTPIGGNNPDNILSIDLSLQNELTTVSQTSLSSTSAYSRTQYKIQSFLTSFRMKNYKKQYTTISGRTKEKYLMLRQSSQKINSSTIRINYETTIDIYVDEACGFALVFDLQKTFKTILYRIERYSYSIASEPPSVDPIYRPVQRNCIDGLETLNVYPLSPYVVYEFGYKASRYSVNPPHVPLCVKQEICIQTILFYFPTKQFCDSCPKSSRNLENCSDQSSCTKCLQGMNPNTKTTCHLCIECDDYGLLQDNHTCEKCNSFIVNCLKCKKVDDEVICLQCMPDKYFLSQNQKICHHCSQDKQNCIKCTHTTTGVQCDDCTEEYYAENGVCRACGQAITNCAKCQVNDACLTCNKTFLLSEDKKKCYCAEGQFEVTGTCTDIIGCVSSHVFSGKLMCLACNSTLLFEYSKQNSNCECKKGYVLQNGELNCTQVCGDGIKFDHFCDDGNLINNDGCSDKCEIEGLYECQNGTKEHRSMCGLVQEFNVSLYSIQRNKGTNEAVLKFLVTPAVYQLAKVKWQDFLTHNLSTSVFGLQRVTVSNLTDRTPQSVLIQAIFDFSEKVEDMPVEFTFEFDRKYFRSGTQTVSLKLESMNQPLTIEEFLEHSTVFTVFSWILVVSALIAFLICLKKKKMIGVQFAQLLQALYFCKYLSASKNPALIYNDLPLLYANGVNSIFNDNEGQDFRVERSMSTLGFEPLFIYNFNLNMLPLFSVLLYSGFLNLKWRLKKRQLTKSLLNPLEDTESVQLIIMEEIKECKMQQKDCHVRLIMPVYLFSLMGLTFSFASLFRIKNVQIFGQAYTTDIELVVASILGVLSLALIYYKLFKETLWILEPVVLKKNPNPNHCNKSDYTVFYMPTYILFYFSLSITFVVSSQYQDSLGNLIASWIICGLYFIKLVFFNPYNKQNKKKDNYKNDNDEEDDEADEDEDDEDNNLNPNPDTNYKLDKYGVIINHFTLCVGLGLITYIMLTTEQQKSSSTYQTILLLWMYLQFGLMFVCGFITYKRMYYHHCHDQVENNPKPKLNKKQIQLSTIQMAQKQQKPSKKQPKRSRADNPYLYQNQVKKQIQQYGMQYHLQNRHKPPIDPNQPQKYYDEQGNQRQPTLAQVKQRLKESYKRRVGQFSPDIAENNKKRLQIKQRDKHY